MELLQTNVQAPIVAGQALVARAPAQAAFDDPAAGQQHEVPLGVPEFDDLQVDAVLLGGLCGCFARVSLISIGQRNVLSGRHLHFFRQEADLRPVLFVGGRDHGRQQVAQRVNATCTFLPLHRLAPS